LRYIGSKERLLDFIYSVALYHNIDSGIFFDIFSGTGVVGRHFKKKGFNVISNDNLFFSYVLQYVYIQMNDYPEFKGLSINGDSNIERCANVIDYLNNLQGKKDFVFENYSPGGSSQRMYFTEENAKKIDAIRCQIENWKINGFIDVSEYYFLICSLVEAVPFVSNIAGVYGAYLKCWDPRAFKKIELNMPGVIISGKCSVSFNEDANKLAKEIFCDLLYIDPPYNERQYITNYHVLETIARWDYPDVYGKTGLRPYDGQKSDYCYKQKAGAALEDLILSVSAEHIIMSYNSEGIISREQIVAILEKKGKVYSHEQDYRRYRSDVDSDKRNYKVKNDQVKELIFYCRVER